MKSEIKKEFDDKIAVELEKIKSIEELKKDDLFKWVFVYGDTLYKRRLDTLHPTEISIMGSKLQSVYGSIIQVLAKADGELDVFEQKKRELMRDLVLKYLADGKYKVTEARSRAELDVVELDDIVNQKRTERNQIKAVAEATEKMSMFLMHINSFKKAEMNQLGHNQNG